MSKIELILEKPIMNAAGSLGFFPDPKGRVDVTRFGAFVTNPISMSPRMPARGKRMIPFPGGFLLHTGYPNPGLKAVIQRHAQRWARSPLPVIVNLLVHDTATLGRMVERREGVEGVIGVEIMLPLDADTALICDVIRAAVGELAVIIRLPIDRVVGENENSPFVDAVIGNDINAISLAPPRGALPDDDGVLVTGRLYGPGVFPQVLLGVKRLSIVDLPVFAGGGIYSQKDVQTLLAAGATAVQLDGVLWRGDLPLEPSPEIAFRYDEEK
jgi:dihydroorotate dehydrogenase (NAD+) catalytic subunit